MSKTETVDVQGTFHPALALDKIHYSPTNPRKWIDKAALEELAASIKQHGVIEPIVVRPHPDKKNQFELVVGERRHRASVIAKVATIPAIERDYSDRDAMEVQQIENLQRADVHPMDEAVGFRRLIKDFEYTAEKIAEKIGKPASYVVRRMALTALMKPLQDRLGKGALPLKYAELLCRFSEKTQEAMGDRLFTQYGNDHGVAKWKEEINDRWSYRDLLHDIERFTLMDLSRAPWKMDVAGPGKAPACDVCPKRSGATPTLFGDLLSQPNVCTYRECFDVKMDAFVDAKLMANPKLHLLTSEYGSREKGVLDHSQFTKYDKNKTKKCDKLEDGIFKDGEQAGHIVQICRDKKCKIHGDQIFSSRNDASSNAERNQRLQRERQQRIEIAARAVEFAAAFRAKKAKEFHLDDLAVLAEYVYDRAYNRDKVAKALGFVKVKSTYSMSYLPSVKAWINKAVTPDLVKFIMLCTINHEIEPGRGGTKDLLPTIAKRWGVDVKEHGDIIRKQMKEKYAAAGKKVAKKKGAKS